MNERPEIIISGVSGRFSNCANVNQLKDKLYKGVDMTYDNEERWPKGIYGLPSKSGALLDLQNFDASFFGLTDEEADLIDPSTRCTIETTFEALCDAGLDPWNLDKRKVGLFHGQTNNEMNRYSVEFEGKSTNLQTQERLIAHIFNIKNGAFLYETACSSSFTALAQAFLHLTCGHIDLAIVSCANIMWTPAIALSYHRLGLTSQMGQCKFLDANASGYGRSETVATIILEKSCTAQRSHGQLINSVINCDGYKPQGITYPSWQSQASLISKCYKESSIDPTTLEYFECHGTGTEVGDMVEIKALWSVMGNGRSKLPLLLGSVKSNLGHSEAGSGLSSLIKCLIIFKLNSIPANLHYEKPSTHITELEKGFVAPVLKETPFKGQYIPINNFGFGGANCHIVLGRSIQNVQDKVSSSSREEAVLILCCGRTTISLQSMMNGIVEMKPESITPHFVHLVNRYSYFMSTTANQERKMNHRSYIISCPRKGLKISSPHELPSSSTKFPICFAFPGAGCQIDNMIQPFMGLRPFRESIEDSLSLVDSDGSKNVREMISNARQSHWKIFTLGIFQIAVVDTLKSLGIVPDIIVGHSFGEYFCAYADGVLSKAEVLDICYSVVQIISSIIAESQTFKSYSMISVALTWDELLPLIPNNLYPACFNTRDNITLAGFTEDIVQFSNHLKVQNIFNRIIDSCGFAFHTQALGKIIELFRCKLTHFSNVYRKPSDKWIISHDSSMNSDKSLNIQKLCVEIIANTVQFEKACKSIPKNAICIEIAPRKFLTSLLKCNLTESLIVEVPFKVGNQQLIQIDDHNNQNNHHHYPELPGSFLTSLGNLYMNGCPINLESIYSHKLIGPSPVDTPFLSPLIKLDHSNGHLVRRFPEYFNSNSSAQEKFTININESDKQYLGFFHYNGYQVIPIAGLIHLLWSKFASLTAHSTNDLAVCLERIKLHRLSLFDDQKLSFLIKFLPTNQGKYKFTIETYSDNLVIMTGLVSDLNDSNGDEMIADQNHDDNGQYGDSNCIESNIFYGILSRNGLHYQGNLRNVIQVNDKTNTGIMSNNQDWIIRFESMLQFTSFFNNQENSSSITRKMDNIPIRLDEIHCIPGQLSQESTVTITYDKYSKIIRSESIYIRGIQFGSFQSQLPCKLKPMEARIEKFIPTFNQKVYHPLETCITIIVDHLIEFTDCNQQQQNESPITLITATLNKDNRNDTKRNDENSLGQLIRDELQKRRSSQCNWIKFDSLNQFTNKKTQLDGKGNDLNEMISNRLLIIETDNSTSLIDSISESISLMTKSTFDFIIVRQSTTTINSDYGENNNELVNYLKSNGLIFVFSSQSDQCFIHLIRWSIDENLINVHKVNSSFKLPSFSNESNNLNCLLVDNLSSSIGLIDRLKIDNQTIPLKWLINETNDENCFNQFIPIGLTYTVLSDGVQGSYHYLPINLSSSSSSSSLSTTTTSSSSSAPSSKLLQSTIGASNLTRIDDETLIKLLSPNDYDTSIVICCNQLANYCGSLIGYSRKGLQDEIGEIGIIKYDEITDDYLIVHRWSYNQIQWSLEEAATIPIPYSLAYYGLIIVGRLARGENVLIVNGHTSVGWAIITICLSFNCTIYLSVETEEEKVNLVKRFPSLVDKQFLITINGQEIEQTIKILTNGYGCDLVINTNSNNNITNRDVNSYDQVKGNQEFLLKCLSIGGRCVDLNKFPMSIDDDLGLAIFLQNITYYGATPEGVFQSIGPNKTGTTGNHPHHRLADLMANQINSGIICPLIGVDSPEIIKIEPKTKCKQQSTRSNNQLPLVNLIIGQPGDLELEIIEKSRRYDSICNFILIPINQSSKDMMMSFSSSSSFGNNKEQSSSPLLLLSSSSNSSTSLSSFPLTPISSTNHQPLTPTPPSSNNNKPSASHYHPYIINQLGLLGCSFIDISMNGKSIDKRDTIKYQQVLKEISKSYKINKVFLVYRSSDPDNQQTNHRYHQEHPSSHHHQQQPHHHIDLSNQLMIQLLDYITNSREISINFLTLISCSLTQDCTFIWPQLVRKCQQFGKRSGVNSITINLTDLFSSDDPNYWSQLDQYISQLYCQLIGSNDMTDNTNNNRKVNGVYKLTCKVDNQ